ncbi:unnamed protein product [Meganyctiphanes norvegica]|uniref:Uncharacterized protein n=1 Tax=Meganyctiphanes norvegica TaxID=48144 RepID=A0AAV2QP45_MEGNR
MFSHWFPMLRWNRGTNTKVTLARKLIMGQMVRSTRIVNNPGLPCRVNCSSSWMVTPMSAVLTTRSSWETYTNLAITIHDISIKQPRWGEAVGGSCDGPGEDAVMTRGPATVDDSKWQTVATAAGAKEPFNCPCACCCH